MIKKRFKNIDNDRNTYHDQEPKNKRFRHRLH